MADLDQISAMIGELRADMKHALRWFDEHEARDERRYDQLAQRIDKSNGYAARIQTLEVHVESSKPVIETVRKMKWVLAGVLATLALLGGTVGGVASQAIKWF